jgi:hypothetical protein
MPRLLASLLLVLVAVSPSSAAVLFFSGFEAGSKTGSAGGQTWEFQTTATTTGAVQMTAADAYSGTAYLAVSPGAAGTVAEAQGLSCSGSPPTCFTRFRFWVQGFGTVDQSLFQMNRETGTGQGWLLISNASKKLFFTLSGTAIATGTTVLSTGTWYQLQIMSTASTTVGGMEVKLCTDPCTSVTTEFSSFGSNTGTTIETLGYGMGWTGTGGASYRYDDVMICDTAYCPLGRTLARQGTAGSPTYDAWTKNSCTGGTIDGCWSNTSFSTASNATSSTASDAQTTTLHSFGTTQTTSPASDHGSQVFSTTDTVNACAVAMVGKVASASDVSIRRRINGSDTDTAKTLTTSDAYYTDGIWTAPVAQINSMEIGAVHGSGVNLATVEDMWVMCDAVANTNPVKHRTIIQ